jgi:hypothetical protein
MKRRGGCSLSAMVSSACDVVAGGQRGFGEVDAHAAPGAGDEPRLLGTHLLQPFLSDLLQPFLSDGEAVWSRPLAASKKARDRGT